MFTQPINGHLKPPCHLPQAQCADGEIKAQSCKSQEVWVLTLAQPAADYVALDEPQFLAEPQCSYL